MPIPINNLGPENAALADELTDRIRAVLCSGDFMLGEEVSLFETNFARWCGVPFAIGVNSGTDAIGLVVEALGIGPGDEVITVPNTFVATVGAIVACGATPVLVDVGADENMDPDLFAAAVTPRTRAVIPVHLRGRPARMDRIMAVAREHGLHVIEDCAQAHGARFGGQLVGTFGVAGAFSMHPQKILGACGDAGAVITSDADLAARVRLLRHHGLSTRDRVERWGHNSRLDSIQAAVLNVKLKYVADRVARQRAIAARYFEGLAGLPLRLPHEVEPEYAAYYLFTLQTSRRDELLAHLHQRGIDARIHYPTPIHCQPAAARAGFDPARLTTALEQSRRILSLPMFPTLTDDEVREVIRCVRGFFEHAH